MQTWHNDVMNMLINVTSPATTSFIYFLIGEIYFYVLYLFYLFFFYLIEDFIFKQKLFSNSALFIFCTLRPLYLLVYK